MLHKNFVKNDIQLELFGGQSKILGGNCPPAAPGYVPAFTDYIGYLNRPGARVAWLGRAEKYLGIHC